jgi:hypothetical protein
MSYKSLVDSQVKKAFSLVKDLAIDAVLTKKVNPVFDFGTGDASTTSEAAITVKIIEIANDKKSQKSNLVQKTFMVKASDVGNLNIYGSINISGADWKLGMPVKDDGTILIGTAFRDQ